MQITFRSRSIEEQITLAEFNEFQSLIGYSLPEDYRQHMLSINGGMVEQDNNAHISNPEAGNGIAYFYPIKYGGTTMETIFSSNTQAYYPAGYIAIGKTKGGGKIIISLNNDDAYGNTKEWYPDGTLNELSPSFTQLISDQVEAVD